MLNFVVSGVRTNLPWELGFVSTSKGQKHETPEGANI